MNIIGLGQAGCNIADKFKEYPQYNVYKIDANVKKTKGVYALKHQKDSEAYEGNVPNLQKTFLKGVMHDVLFITSCGNVSGASLRLINQLYNKKCNITVLYIKPDTTSLPKEKILQNNLIFNVFQEYARSAIFERLYIIDNTRMAEIIGEVPVREYFNQINQLICSTIHMINVFDNQDCIMGTFPSKSIATAKISTFGLIKYDTGEEKMFFNLNMPREKRYYYAMPEKIIESDGALIKNIKKHVKNNLEHDKMNNSYAIYSTTYKEPYVYCVSNSTLIQKNEKSA